MFTVFVAEDNFKHNVSIQYYDVDAVLDNSFVWFIYKSLFIYLHYCHRMKVGNIILVIIKDTFVREVYEIN